MEVIKEAFVEGRETETSWDDSKAKKNTVKVDVALENLSLMSKREFGAAIPLHQIDPATGKVITTFPSRLAAARHIVTNILKRPEKNPLSVTGNMEMCMRAGWKAYGFYWKLATPESIKKYSKTPVNAKKVWVNGRGASGVFPSIQAAANSIGVTTDVIRSAMAPNSASKTNGKKFIIQEFQPTFRRLKFKSVTEAASYANCSHNTMVKWIKENQTVNNTKYSVDGYAGIPTKNKTYALYQGRKKIGEFDSTTEIAKIVGTHRTTVAKKIKANKPLGEFEQYNVVKRK